MQIRLSSLLLARGPGSGVPSDMTETLLFWLATATVALLALTMLEVLRGRSRLRHLHRVPPVPPGEAPPLSVVIAARDEARGIEAALGSVLRQAYPRLEVIVVDDRSTDGTGEILDRMAARHPRLRVVHLETLPEGWLGKNHALHAGAAEAAGEYLFFTDADVVLHPTTLARGVGYMREHGVDHLAAGPRVELPTAGLRFFVTAFTLYFTLFTRPWRARDPGSAAHIGVGAFNLLRTEVYRAMGGHRPIAMRPDDDMKLGKLVKKHGFRQDFVVAAELVSVEWYATLREMVQGLMKNGFSGVEYRLSLVVLATVMQLLFFVFPWVAVWITEGPTRALFAAAVGVEWVLYAGAAREQRVSPLYGLGFPLASLLFLYVIWKAALLTLLRGGIDWRGTRYSLEELRANRV
jgi:cellulose synthase/poly-beta-1,6-N-acetylglucosamine synthase-like glycosyltransferase